jgi:uncharacterized protein (DUF1697 family)
MERQILLLRGVNVSGANKLPMAEFRAMLTGLGLTGVATYIQSGNAVFAAKGDPLPAIAAGLKDRFGLTPELFLYDLAGYRAILAENPFAEAGRQEGAKVHLIFLKPATGLVDLAALQALAVDGEALHLTPLALYFNAPNGVGQSVLAAKMQRFIKAPQTGRNQRSAEAILALAEAL